MNRDELIETIIKEVKRVLAERGVSVAPASGGTIARGSLSEGGSAQDSSSLMQKPSAVPVTTPQPGISGVNGTFGCRDLTGKQIITQKDLEKYTGVSIEVTRQAVITPLAFDYAKAKGISIKRVEKQAVTTNNPAPVMENGVVALVAAYNFPGDNRVVNTILTMKGFQIREFAGHSYEAAVKKLSHAVASGSVHFGICIEKTGMEGPIHANRNPKINAVHCRDTYEARAARIDYGANVIVIDSISDPEAVISGFCGI